MANERIREEAKRWGIPLWRIGKEVGRSEVTMIRWLREELSPDKAKLVQEAIDRIKAGDRECKKSS